MYVYRCEDTQESIFTAIYNVYEEHRQREEVRLEITDEPLLFAEDIFVETDYAKAGRVAETIIRRFGRQDCHSISYALAADNPDKAQAVYRVIMMGLKENVRHGHLLDNLADDNVRLVFSLAGYTGREYDHLRGFMRFEELENGALYARFAPRSNLLPFLMGHFADRLPAENFVIYDEKRKCMGVHKAGCIQWYLMMCDENTGEPIEHNRLKLSEGEEEYSELFKWFCEKIAVRERRSLSLQRKMLPLRFRGYMTEFGNN
ncbi:MAG: TIGR03915 family putative DNA repair protein [Lachnospiraceae bacterium]|nr:TIGR03915 family putative DNA repair protein [Lachnospiraceae bacterium]